MDGLWKTTIVIWSDFDPDRFELEDIAREATEGAAFCASMKHELVADPSTDPAWQPTEFFDDPLEA